MEGDAPFIDAADHGHGVFGLEGMAQKRVAHATAGAVAHLHLLDMVARGGEQAGIAGMVEMHMGQDDIADGRGLHADAAQALGHRAADGTVAALRGGLVEAGVDDETSILADDGPDEEVERHRRVMRIAAKEIVSAPPPVD